MATNTSTTPSVKVNGITKPFTLGVLLLPPVQLLDLSSADLFGMLTPEYLKACNLPGPLLALGVPVDIKYICSSHSDTSSHTTEETKKNTTTSTNIVPLTAQASVLSTASLTHPSVQPSHLGLLLIPGPDPAYTPTADEKSFIKAHADHGTDILTVCTGIFPAGHAGILDGRQVTGPRALVSALRTQFPLANWSEKRWEYDAAGGSQGKRAWKGELWTSAGITNGLDMVAAYFRAKAGGSGKTVGKSEVNGKPVHANKAGTLGMSTELVDLICRMADVGDRSQEYDVGRVKETGWWIWLIARSWWRGGEKKKLA